MRNHIVSEGLKLLTPITTYDESATPGKVLWEVFEVDHEFEKTLGDRLREIKNRVEGKTLAEIHNSVVATNDPDANPHPWFKAVVWDTRRGLTLDEETYNNPITCAAICVQLAVK